MNSLALSNHSRHKTRFRWHVKPPCRLYRSSYSILEVIHKLSIIRWPTWWRKAWSAHVGKLAFTAEICDRRGTPSSWNLAAEIVCQAERNLEEYSSGWTWKACKLLIQVRKCWTSRQADQIGRYLVQEHNIVIYRSIFLRLVTYHVRLFFHIQFAKICS